MKIRMACIILLALSLTACGTSQGVLDATTTQVAHEIYGTQTALAPTSTPPLLLTEPAEEAQQPLYTPAPSSTPIPPVNQLTEEEQEVLDDLIKCYKAAVSVMVDWEVHRTIIKSSQDINKLEAFLWERNNRIGGVKFLDSDGVYSKYDTMIVDGVKFVQTHSKTGNCDPYLSSIISSADGLRWGPWGVGASSRLSMYRSTIRSTVSDMRKELHDDYGVYNVILDSYEDTFWIYVHNQYGIELPDWLE